MYVSYYFSLVGYQKRRKERIDSENVSSFSRPRIDSSWKLKVDKDETTNRNSSDEQTKVQCRYCDEYNDKTDEICPVCFGELHKMDNKTSPRIDYETRHADYYTNENQQPNVIVDSMEIFIDESIFDQICEGCKKVCKSGNKLCEDCMDENYEDKPLFVGNNNCSGAMSYPHSSCDKNNVEGHYKSDETISDNDGLADDDEDRTMTKSQTLNGKLAYLSELENDLCDACFNERVTVGSIPAVVDKVAKFSDASSKDTECGWMCSACTFLNSVDKDDCEACNVPRHKSSDHKDESSKQEISQAKNEITAIIKISGKPIVRDMPEIAKKQFHDEAKSTRVNVLEGEPANVMSYRNNNDDRKDVEHKSDEVMTPIDVEVDSIKLPKLRLHEEIMSENVLNKYTDDHFQELRQVSANINIQFYVGPMGQYCYLLIRHFVFHHYRSVLSFRGAEVPMPLGGERCCTAMLPFF